MKVILLAIDRPEVQDSGCEQVRRSFVIRKSESNKKNIIVHWDIVLRTMYNETIYGTKLRGPFK